LAADIKVHFLASRASQQQKRSNENLLHSIRRTISYSALIEKSDVDVHEREALLYPRRTWTPTYETTPISQSAQNQPSSIGKLLSRTLSGCFEVTMEDKLNEILRIQYEIVDGFSKIIYNEVGLIMKAHL